MPRRSVLEYKQLDHVIVSVVEVTNREVHTRTATTLSCTVTGITVPVTITWSGFTDNGVGYSQGIGEILSGKQTTTLTVSGDMVTEDKIYTCTVSDTVAGISVDQQEVVHLDVYG